MTENCFYLAGVMDDAEVGFILQFLWLEELGVSALLLEHLLHKALVGGFGEPTLLIQQSEDTRRTGLHTEESALILLHEEREVQALKHDMKVSNSRVSR